jgi:hypothetical protein
MHVKMTRIESGVTVPKGLFILYMNVKIVIVPCVEHELPLFFIVNFIVCKIHINEIIFSDLSAVIDQ